VSRDEVDLMKYLVGLAEDRLEVLFEGRDEEATESTSKLLSHESALSVR